MWAAFADGAQLIGGAIQRVRAGHLAEEPDPAPLDALRFLPWPYGTNCGFTRSVFDDVGGFDEAFFAGGDETEFFWRAQLHGHQLRTVPGSVVTYAERDGLKSVFSQKFKYGRAAVQLYAKFRDSGMPRSSTHAAVRKWARLPLKVASALVGRGAWYDVVVSAAFAAGRLSGSWRYRVWYP
jgi:GT2 family glycosyltransferase